MNMRVVSICMAIAIQAAPSWGQTSSVIQDGKAWLQPKYFTNYSYNEISAVCPEEYCSGMLPGSGFNLDGYMWASSDDVNMLFSAYREAGRAILEDFAYTTTDLSTHILYGMLRDPPNGNRIFIAAVAGVEPYNPDGEVTEVSDFPIYPSSKGDYFGVWFWRPVDNEFMVHLEEPINGEVHSGIGNLRGWAIAEDGIDRVEIYIDGKYAYNAPYGGRRGDVKNDYPSIPDSGDSGFSLAFGYSNLGFGQHTIMARAFNKSGEWVDASSTFDVAAFDKKFIQDGDVVDASEAQTTASGDEISIENISIGDRLYDLRLKWRTQEQGFEIVEIR